MDGRKSAVDRCHSLLHLGRLSVRVAEYRIATSFLLIMRMISAGLGYG
jgi:hypothetical protein